MHVILSTIIWFIVGISTAYLAYQRGRDPYFWFAIGIVLGIFGLLLLFILPEASESGNSSKNDRHSPSSITIEASPAQIVQHYHDYLIKDWFCIDNAHQHLGPMRFDLLKTLWKEGKVDSHAFVWCEGMQEWQRIENLPAVYEALSKKV